MLIALVGSDGAGKSLQARRLCDRLAAQGRVVERVDMWDLLDPERHPEARFFTGGRPMLRNCIAEMAPPARGLFLFWMIASVVTERRAAAPDAVLVVDGYWYKHAAAEHALGAGDTVAVRMPEPDLVLHLDVSPAVALARKQPDGLTLYECGCDGSRAPASFLAHQAKVRCVLQRWARERGWCRIDADRDADSVSAAIVAAADAALRVAA